MIEAHLINGNITFFDEDVEYFIVSRSAFDSDYWCVSIMDKEYQTTPLFEGYFDECCDYLASLRITNKNLWAAERNEEFETD